MSEGEDRLIRVSDEAATNESSPVTTTPQRVAAMRYEDAPAVSPGMVDMKPDPRTEAINDAVRQLIDAATKLTVKVATCSCDKTDGCGVFKFAKEVAKAIDRLQSLST